MPTQPTKRKKIKTLDSFFIGYLAGSILPVELLIKWTLEAQSGKNVNFLKDLALHFEKLKQKVEEVSDSADKTSS